MELAGLSMENFPPVAGNDSKTLRKLSLLEARMVGAGGESRDASLPPNDGSRGSENNSNSTSTIGFPKPRSSVVASPESGSRSNARRHAITGGILGTEQEIDDRRANGKRKAPADGTFSPPRPALPPHGTGTPSTLSTSPGESRECNTARSQPHAVREDGSELKRARAGGTRAPSPLPPPARLSIPHHDGDRPPYGAGLGAQGVIKVPSGQGRRAPRGGDCASPSGTHSTGKSASRHISDQPSQGRDLPPTKSGHSVAARTASDGNFVGSSIPGGGQTSIAALTSGMCSDFSPQGSGKNGRGIAVGFIPGVGQAMMGGSTKTIQSYFRKPSSGFAAHALAASYAGGEPCTVASGSAGLSSEMDLSEVDEENPHEIEQSQGQAMGRISKSASAGRAGFSGGVSLQQRFMHVASGDHDGDQGQGHGPTHSRRQGDTVAGCSRLDGKDIEQPSPRQQDFEVVLEKLREAEAEMGRLHKELERANLECSGIQGMADALQKQLDSKITEFKEHEEKCGKQMKQLTVVVEELLRKVSAQEASDCRAKLARDTLELGKIVSVKTGHIGKYVEAFEEGASFKEVERKVADMLLRKTRLEARKRAVTKLLKASNAASVEGQSDVQARLEAIEEEETVRMHLTALKREEIALQEEKRALDARKVLHIRELKRVAHEDRSKFANRPTLSSRYVLLNLLGKGGFSEVWRAFDLVQAEDVAVKVHQLLNNWNEAQKANFIRHVTREYEIHQQMRHPRIVNLTDVFEICCDSFATVLDYCRGTDLECVLRERKYLPERDARALILQVARGLQYLNTAQEEGREGRGAIIHYDLKPGNILLDEHGDVKITDFGLSKILEIKKDTERGTGGGTSMELTSKGAGTYWYLPPECFGDNPRISSKVDVWSLGVVFYQMLYGIRPFGEGLSQEKILREKVIVNANRVEFPPKPIVSEEAKSFIRACLTYTHATRPDVHAMCNLPYLTTPLPKRSTS